MHRAVSSDIWCASMHLGASFFLEDEEEDMYPMVESGDDNDSAVVVVFDLLVIPTNFGYAFFRMPSDNYDKGIMVCQFP